MNKKFVEKFTAVVSAVCMISVGIASVNAAEIDDGFESVTKNAQSSDSSFPSAYSAIGYSLVDENGLPSNFSSKNLGFVTPIKAQQYNDCWAVAGTEGFDSFISQAEKDLGIKIHIEKCPANADNRQAKIATLLT